MTTHLTRCNLVTGFVGAGKTTTLRSLLGHRPPGERWAVLLNEFGAARLDPDEGVIVREVAGGCVCCTAQVTMRVALTRLLREVKPDRLLIEPTSAGHLAKVMQLLREPALERAVELRATLCVVDPDQFARPDLAARDEYREQIALADVVMVNKCDVAPRVRIEAVLAFVRSLHPARVLVETAMGKIDPALLDAGAAADRRGRSLHRVP